MEVLTNIGIAILCALGSLVFLVIVWFVVGMVKAMYGIFFKTNPRRERGVCAHDFLVKDVSLNGPLQCSQCGKVINNN